MQRRTGRPRKSSRVGLVVRGLSLNDTVARLSLGTATHRCALGRSGRRAIKREGDGATPLGTWRLMAVLYRSDRISRPCTALPVRAIRRADGWCDAPADPNYNRPVRLPYRASAEEMWRSDGLYDIVVVLDHNTRPRRRNAGSAIFMHVARPGFKPTAGCIALERHALLSVLARSPRTIRITA